MLISRIDGVGLRKMEQPQFLFREKLCADDALLVKQSYVRIVQYFIRSFAPTAWLSVHGVGGAYGLDTVDLGRDDSIVSQPSTPERDCAGT